MSDLLQMQPGNSLDLAWVLGRCWRRYCKYRRAIVDLLVLGVLAVMTSALALSVNAVDKLLDYFNDHERQISKIALTVTTVLLCYMTVFAIRRWVDARKMLIAASTDSLTGILNRRKGWELLKREVTRSARYNRPLAMIMFDIDHFKTVNDTYGHRAGDYALRALANLVQIHLRATDIFIRWGGEEFLIVAVETALYDARRLAERLRVIIEKYPFEIGSLTVSCGVAQRVENEDIEALLERVDAKLYEAKSAGRNRVSGWPNKTRNTG